MASGLFFGGLASGFQRQEAINNQQNYQQGLLQLEQQRLQQQQQNQKRAEYMQLRSQAIQDMQNTVTAVKNAHPTWTDAQVLNFPALVAQRDQLSGFDKNLGLDPNSSGSILAGMVAGKSQIETEGAIARAKEGPLGQELKLSEVNKNRAFAGQPPVDMSGKPANPTNPDLDTDTQLGGKPFKTTGNPQSDSILKGIDNGDTPPDLKGIYGKNKTQIMAGAENNGINLAQKQLQWERAKKLTQSLNSSQMVRYAGLNESVINTIDEVNGLAKKLSLSGIPLLNQAELTKLIQTEGNSPKGQLAAQYIGAVNTLKEEFANLAQGGYAPTEPAWKLANEQINANYGVNELSASLGEVRKLINIRFNAIPGMGTLGPNSANQYTGKKQQDNDFQPVPGFPGVTVRQIQ